MSEITNLRVLLKNNPYGEYIIPVIEYLNDPSRLRSGGRKRTMGWTNPYLVNPFEALVVAAVLKNRLESWNGGYTPIQGINYDVCCCPSTTTSGNNCSWCKNHTGAASSCCPVCPDSGGASTARTSQTLPGSQVITEFAAYAGMANPFTPMIKSFEVNIGGMNMDLANSYIFFQQIIDVFYANVDFLNFFMVEFVDGFYGSFVNVLLGADYRMGYRSSGIDVRTVRDGSATPEELPKTVITSGGLTPDVSPGTEAPYFTVYGTLTYRNIVWFNPIGNGYVQPVVPPISGVTDNYVQISMNNTDNGVKFSQELEAQLGAAADTFLGAITRVNNVVTINAASSESVIGTYDFTLPCMLPGWSFAYSPYVPGSSLREITAIDYIYANARDLHAKYFVMYDGTEAHMFYYQVNGVAVDPDSLGFAYDFAHAINVVRNCIDANGNERPCPQANLQIQRDTDAVINAVGLWKQVGHDGCCDENPPNCPDWQGCLVSGFALIAAKATTDSNGGTVQVGAANQVTDLIAPYTGTNYGGPYVKDIDYVTAYNTILVPAERAKGNHIGYLKAVYAGNGCVPKCKCQTPACIEPDTGYIYLRTEYPSVTSSLPFNRPASGYVAERKERCKDC